MGGAGLRRRPAQSARQHRLRPEVRRRDQRRLGRQVLRRPDGRPRLPGEAALHRHGPHGRGRGVVRRLHDELVRRSTPTKFKTLITTAASTTSTACTPRPTNCGSTSGSTAARPGARTASRYEKHSPHRFAKNFKTPMLIIHNDLDFRVPVERGPSAVHHARSGRACRRS